MIVCKLKVNGAHTYNTNANHDYVQIKMDGLINLNYVMPSDYASISSYYGELQKFYNVRQVINNFT